MILAHKIKLNPTPEQEVYFRKACGTVRFAYNWGLAEWKRRHEAGESVSWQQLDREFNAIKDEQFPWVREVSSVCPQYAFRCLGKAFGNFFRRVKDGEKKPGCPRFKSKHHGRHTFYITNQTVKLAANSVFIPRLGWVNMTETLRFDGKINSAVVSYDGGRWWISISVEMPDVNVPVTGDPVGIDLGIKSAAVCDNGRVLENQKHLGQELRKLRRLNRELARREKGSRGWWRTKDKLAKLHFRIRSRRLDAIHKFTTAVVKEASIIGLENLNVQGMMQNRHLARAVSDVGMYEIRRQLEYKAKLYGATVILVDRWYPSSKTCHACGHKNDNLTLADRSWACPNCGCSLDRDINAARNLRDEAMRLAG